jgi:hypothetical protein
METKCPTIKDATAVLNQLTADQVARRLSELDAEAKCLRLLLRFLRARESATGTPLFQTPFEQFLQQVAGCDPEDENAMWLLEADKNAAEYVRRGAVQEAQREIRIWCEITSRITGI